MSSSFCAAGKYVLQNHKTKKAKLIKRTERERERERETEEERETNFVSNHSYLLVFSYNMRRIKMQQNQFSDIFAVEIHPIHSFMPKSIHFSYQMIEN